MKTVATFEVKYQQYLDPHAKIVQPLPPFAADKKCMLTLYKAIRLLHLFDKKVLMMHRTGKIGTYAGTLGQEAVGIGAASCLTESDIYVPYYRSAPDMYMRGIRLHEVLSYWRGDERGSDYQDPRARNDLPIPVCIATQLLHAAGIATAMKLRKQKDRAVLAMIGDGGTSEGDFYEAINVAGAWNLPLVIVINNNCWAISETNAMQTSCATLAQKAIAGGFDGIQVDGNDVIAVKAATEAALEKARKGGGPSLIEAITYRLCAHTTLDDMDRYIDSEKHKLAWLQEPQIRLKKYLLDQKMLTEEMDAEIEEASRKTIDQEIEISLNLQTQPVEAMFDYLYATLPEKTQQQRQQAIQLGDHKCH